MTETPPGVAFTLLAHNLAHLGRLGETPPRQRVCGRLKPASNTIFSGIQP
jgi:hypothetical protein